MSTIWALIKALPEILALLKLIDAKCKEIKIENDVKKTFKPYTRLLKRKTQMSLGKFLILSFLFLTVGGCASKSPDCSF